MTLPTPGFGRLRQAAVYGAGVLGRRPRVPVAVDRLERAAVRRMSADAAAYVVGGAGREATMAADRAALDSWSIVPRVLRDVSARDLSTELFDRVLPAPVLLAPVGVTGMVRHDGDLAAARAGAALGVPVVFSHQASVPMERCATAMDEVIPGAPRWFQLYWSSLDELVESFVARAEACGCEAIVVTLDTTLLGWRPRDLDRGSLPFARGWGIAQYTSDPVFRRLAAERATSPGSGDRPRPTLAAVRALVDIARAHPGSSWANLRSPVPRASVQLFLDTYSRPSVTWDELAWLRARTGLPLLLKGILHADDARLALDHGVDGVIVSTHGGRQVDGSVPAIDALPGIVQAVGDRLPVLLDSGVRTGSDVLKALSLGARAVLLGRPWVYGLALGGREGVSEVLQNVIAELDLTMGLAGCAKVRDARSVQLVRAGGDA